MKRSYVILVVETHGSNDIPDEELAEIYGTWVEHIPQQFRRINTENAQGTRVFTEAIAAVSATVIPGIEIPEH